MKTIWKYKIPLKDYFTTKMPEHSIIISVGEQNNDMVMWAIVDNNCPEVEVKFALFGTGFPLDEDKSLQFVGTIQRHDGLVFHLFMDTTVLVTL